MGSGLGLGPPLPSMQYTAAGGSRSTRLRTTAAAHGPTWEVRMVTHGRCVQAHAKAAWHKLLVEL
jgi:hypothetical protein